MADISLAAGRVTTGFSYPYVAIYDSTDASYTGVQELARGVSVSIEPESSDNNPFYANNIEAENDAGKFNGGTMTLTVDGLLQSAEALIMGIVATVDGIEYGDSVEAPYVGIGFITRYRSGGETSYVPTLIRKVRFDVIGNDAETQEEDVDWQTQELTANIYRSDRSDRSWKWEGVEQATEAAAVTALLAKINAAEPDES